MRKVERTHNSLPDYREMKSEDIQGRDNRANDERKARAIILAA